MHMTDDKTKLHGKVSELVDLLPTLYPKGISEGLYLNELSETMMINLGKFSSRYEDKEVNFEEYQLIALTCLIDEDLIARGMYGNFNKNTVYDAVFFYIHKNIRNLRREWLESLVWDGKPRVCTFFQDVIGASIPSLSPQDSDEYIGKVTIAWAMGSIFRQYGSAQADVIPLLIGDQRIGKSNCLRFLAGGDQWFKDTTSDMTDPKSFLESIRGSVIVELSEATAIRSKESERTKSFVSKREDTYRRPYERTTTTTPRRWVLIGTSNLRTPFTDITGNMRYFPIYCNDLPTNRIKTYFADPAYAKYDCAQFWAEAMEMYRKGETPNLSMEIKELSAQVQDSASKHDDLIEYVNDYLDNDPVFSKKGAFISRTELYAIMRAAPIGMDCAEGKNRFTFAWYNTAGNPWHESRRYVTNSLGQTTYPRGYVRQSDANPQYGV